LAFLEKYRMGLLGVLFCVSLADMPASGQTSPESTQRRPEEVKPPRKPSEVGFQAGLIFGINVLVPTSYNYNTRITLPDGQQLQYSGSHTSAGVTAALGGSLTFPGALRRLTVGVNVDAGGLDSAGASVIPENTATPFSQQNLQKAVETQQPFGMGWHPGITSYVEHDIWRVSESRVRIGYQYWRQSGAYHGTFAPGPFGIAAYDIAMNDSSHMIRVSLNHNIYLNDVQGTTGSSSNSAPRSGITRILGVTAGSHKTVMVFFAIGPLWAF
jgi:hypothetical protein